MLRCLEGAMLGNEAAIANVEIGTVIKDIVQEMIPFKVPLFVPLVNPFSDKQLLFRAQYKITGVTVDEAVTGVLFGNYRDFMDIKWENYSRADRTRHLEFNPFTKKLEELGRNAGKAGEAAGWGTATMMGAGLGLIEWKIRVEDGATPDRVCTRFDTKAKLFGGHFKINVVATADGVVLEDDWTPEGGADMRTSYLMMANLVLSTHPKGFEHIANAFVAEVTRARAAGRPYEGEIGPPSVDADWVS